MKYAIAAMKPGGVVGRGGSIINVSSLAGVNGFVSHGAYGASKASVRGLSKTAALECAQFGYGIRVNSVHPAVIPTDMAPDMWQQFIKLGLVEDEQGAKDMVTAMHPLGLGTPEDVAAGCLYLASQAWRWDRDRTDTGWGIADQLAPAIARVCQPAPEVASAYPRVDEPSVVVEYRKSVVHVVEGSD